MDSPFKSQVVDDTGPDGIDILSSCNGLILMSSLKASDTLSLWNPSTKDFKEIVVPEIKYIYGVSNITYGFGYDSDNDDYKIVKATSYGSNFFEVHKGCQVQVYTSSSHSWKTLPNIFPYHIYGFNNIAEVIFVCGAFHWIAENLQNKETCILAFDIHDDNFREVELTDELYNSEKFNHHTPLSVLQGCLCMILLSNNDTGIEVWMMEEYEVKESWTKLFIAQLPVEFTNRISYVKILWEFKNGEVLFVMTTASYGTNTCFVIYDLVSQITKVTKIQHIPKYEKWNIVAYVESLVSLISIDGLVREQGHASKDQENQCAWQM